ncbi:hypothetical protein HYALB_00003583 [Hymenoscyphus albidus]|uniref:Uncharacterized protein n=1 Tax=Hymenoscyphus albidus TaxID=595503 RepID=A0A9N9M2N4_9HELO|nr:hypothetical protein HYALB_00003583 [Hymenoscyphus albidus]
MTPSNFTIPNSKGQIADSVTQPYPDWSLGLRSSNGPFSTHPIGLPRPKIPNSSASKEKASCFVIFPDLIDGLGMFIAIRSPGDTRPQPKITTSEARNVSHGKGKQAKGRSSSQREAKSGPTELYPDHASIDTSLPSKTMI